MICEQCKAEGKTSRVRGGYGISTCMGVDSYYDEKGHYHRHDPNSTGTQYSCSNGHSWSKTTYHECPSCDYNRDRMTTRLEPQKEG